MAPRPSDVDLSYVPSMRRLEGGGEAGMSFPLPSDGMMSSRRFKADKMRGLVSSRRRKGSSFVPVSEDDGVDGVDLNSRPWDKSSDSGWASDTGSVDRHKRGSRRRGGPGAAGTYDVDSSSAGAFNRPTTGDSRSASVSAMSQGGARVSTRISASPKAASPSSQGRPRSPPPSLRASVASAPPAWAPAPSLGPSLSPTQEQTGPTLSIPHGQSSRPASPVPSPLSAGSQRMAYRGRWSPGIGSGPSPTAGRLTIVDPMHRKSGDRTPGASLSATATGGRGLLPGSPSATLSPGRLPSAGTSGSPRRVSLAQHAPGQVSVSTFDSSLAAKEGETGSPRAALGRSITIGAGDMRGHGPEGDWGNMWRDALHRTQASARRFAQPVQRGIDEGPDGLQTAWGEGLSSFVGMLEKGKEQGQAALERLRTAVFQRVDGERSFCPRCRGSGFSKAGSGPMGWLSGGPSGVAGRGTGSLDPCWFCQGIGVMPILDLEGYVVARSPVLVSRTARPTSSSLALLPPAPAAAASAATSAFTLARRSKAAGSSNSVEEFPEHLELPASSPAAATANSPNISQGLLPLYLSKFPEARCCFRISRLPKSLRKALFAPPAGPSAPLTGKQLHMRELQILAQVLRPEIPTLKPPPAGKGQAQSGLHFGEQQQSEAAVCGACGVGVPADAGRCPVCSSKLVLREGEWGADEERGPGIVGSVRVQSARARTRQMWDMQREQEHLLRTRNPAKSAGPAPSESLFMWPIAPPQRTVSPTSPIRAVRGPSTPWQTGRSGKAGVEAGEMATPRTGAKKGGARKSASKKAGDSAPKGDAAPITPYFLRLRNKHQAPVPGVDEVSSISSRGLTLGSSVPSTAKAGGGSASCAACEAGIAISALAPLSLQGEGQEPGSKAGVKHMLRSVMSHTCGKGAAQGGVLANTGSPRVMGMRSPRRMERNKIREQAERHAQDRARWRQYQLSMAQAQSPRRHCQPTSADAAEGSDFCYIGEDEEWGP